MAAPRSRRARARIGATSVVKARLSVSVAISASLRCWQSASCCPIHQQRLRVGALQLDGAVHQTFDRIGDIVRLIEHVRRPQRADAAPLGIHQLVEDQKQPVRIDRACIQIVIAVFRVVEVKAAELAGVNQPRDDHLDIDVRRVMTEVHQAAVPGCPESARPSANCPNPG